MKASKFHWTQLLVQDPILELAGRLLAHDAQEPDRRLGALESSLGVDQIEPPRGSEIRHREAPIHRRKGAALYRTEASGAQAEAHRDGAEGSEGPAGDRVEDAVRVGIGAARRVPGRPPPDRCVHRRSASRRRSPHAWADQHLGAGEVELNGARQGHQQQSDRIHGKLLWGAAPGLAEMDQAIPTHPCRVTPLTRESLRPRRERIFQ